MDVDVPYMPSVKNLHKILDKMQKAAVPEAFGIDFLKDLGFSSSNDRSVIKLFKFLGMLDSSSRPQASYREFVDHTKAKAVLAARLKAAYDDLFLSDKDAHTKTAQQLKGWFKTKTGTGDAVAQKIATTFKALASYADFTALPATVVAPKPSPVPTPTPPKLPLDPSLLQAGFGLIYRLEIHLPDTTNVDTFRSIFRALREELLS